MPKASIPIKGLEASTSHNRSGSYLPTLDGWRAIAVSLVILDHFLISLSARVSGVLPDQLIWQLESLGQRGVDIFFALSGFLICYRLVEEKERNGSISLVGFYIRRIFRILPAVFLYLSVLLILGSLTSLSLSRSELTASFLFFRNYIGEFGANHWYTGHLWTLSIEEHFYLILPGLLAAAGTTKRSRVLGLCLIGAVTIWRTLSLHVLPPIAGDIPPLHRTDFRLDALMWGAVAALFMPYFRQLGNIQLRRIFKVSLACVLLLAIPLWRVVSITPPRWVLTPIFMALVLPTGVLLHPFSFGNFLENPFVRWIGRLSYSIYIWQMIFLCPPGVDRPLGILQSAPIGLLFIFPMACLSYYCIEKPCVRLGRSLGKRAIYNKPVRRRAASLAS